MTEEKPPDMLCFPSLHSSQVGKQIGKTSGGFPIYELKRTVLPLLSALVLFLIGCQPIEKTAQEVLAANKGYLEAAITKNAASCMANPSQTVCQVIVKDAYAQGAAVTALEVYCQIPPHTLTNPPLKCTPLSSASSALQDALSNVNALTADIRKAAGQ